MRVLFGGLEMRFTLTKIIRARKKLFYFIVITMISAACASQLVKLLPSPHSHLISRRGGLQSLFCPDGEVTVN